MAGVRGGHNASHSVLKVRPFLQGGGGALTPMCHPQARFVLLRLTRRPSRKTVGPEGPNVAVSGRLVGILHDPEIGSNQSCRRSIGAARGRLRDRRSLVQKVNPRVTRGAFFLFVRLVCLASLTASTPAITTNGNPSLLRTSGTEDGRSCDG